MQSSLDFADDGFRAVSPFFEMGAYEALWDEKGATFRRLADRFSAHNGAMPSDFVKPDVAQRYAHKVMTTLKQGGVENFGVRINGLGDYPNRLRDAEHPIEFLYFQGWWELSNFPRLVAVVGTRNPSVEGEKRTRHLCRRLVEDGVVVVSGLAKGVDTAAHLSTIESGGKTIAVLGTPLNHRYPKENTELQQLIASDHLLVSQVPVERYFRATSPTHNNHFFPERNKTMSALTQATIIVEAGETSGTLVQAKAALRQNRKLLILESCFQNPAISWPQKFEAVGAIRVRDYDDIRRALGYS